MLRLLRFMLRKPMESGPFILNPIEPRVWSPEPGGSILITSAPRSPSSMHAYGPAITWLMSRTRTPARGSGLGVEPDIRVLADLRPLLLLSRDELRELLGRAAAVLGAELVELVLHVLNREHLVEVLVHAPDDGRVHLGGAGQAVPRRRFVAGEAFVLHRRHLRVRLGALAARLR